MGSDAWSRRAALRLALGSIVLGHWGGRAWAHDAVGRVDPPLSAPRLNIVPLDAPPNELPSLLIGRVTAIQLMFTGCSATCPIQGAVFGEVQRLLRGSAAHLRLLSISIDPLGDTPNALRNWLRSFGAEPSRWTGALTTARALDPLLDFLRGRATGVDRHTPQVYLFDRQARLRVRTVDMPSPAYVATAMREVDAL
jgi:protein SCO1